MAEKKVKKANSQITTPWHDSRIILTQPHLTEKATRLEAKERTYIFKVGDTATKIDIANEVAAKFNVKVEAVRSVRIPARAKRVGKSSGWTSAFKKAYVKLKKGEKLEAR